MFAILHDMWSYKPAVHGEPQASPPTSSHSIRGLGPQPWLAFAEHQDEAHAEVDRLPKSPVRLAGRERPRSQATRSLIRLESLSSCSLGPPAHDSEIQRLLIAS